MEQQARNTDPVFEGARHCDLKKSFKLAVRSLLTSCSREEFSKAFPGFTSVEQDSLHKLFIQVVTSLHENIEAWYFKVFNRMEKLVTLNEPSFLYSLKNGRDLVEKDEFESLCLETQVGIALDTVEQLVEEQALNPLFSDKTNVIDAVRDLQIYKKNEIQYLRGMLEEVEDLKRQTQARIDVLMKERKEVVRSTDTADKLRGCISSYRTSNGRIHDDI